MLSKMAKIARNFRLDPDLFQRLETHARVSGESMTEVVERGIVLALDGVQSPPAAEPQTLIPTTTDASGLKHVDVEALKSSLPPAVPQEQERAPQPPDVRDRLIRERADQLSGETDLEPPELRRKAELELEEQGLIW